MVSFWKMDKINPKCTWKCREPRLAKIKENDGVGEFKYDILGVL
jgi:hypothetical protein